jgi:hypothetical protein
MIIRFRLGSETVTLTPLAIIAWLVWLFAFGWLVSVIIEALTFTGPLPKDWR